jgi:hypothetical protein
MEGKEQSVAVVSSFMLQMMSGLPGRIGGLGSGLGLGSPHPMTKTI